MANTERKVNDHFINDSLISKSLIAADYNPTHHAMLQRTLERIALKKQQGLRTPDELWIVDHNDVYTLGQAGKEEHILQHTDTPIIKTDRGGQVTWHGHGQLVIYWLFDLHSLGWSVRNLVTHAEQAIEDVVNDCLNNQSSGALDSSANTSANFSANTDTNISAHARRDAPGVYLYNSSYADMSNIDSKIDSGDKPETPAAAADNNSAIMLGKIASLGFKIKHGFSYHGIALNVDCDLSAFNAINPCGYAGMQMLRLADFTAMKDAMDKKNKKGAEQLSYEQVTQKLIDNVAQRHAGLIELRPIASK
ncbi:lipoyl protein ligase domain-containing protein [Psychrobacter sp. LV10R520-6]|uniref:lipoyl protein ligase domain-containing protein n=1 Tax=Psychrobacter sp. LV10R520-6 TaxID=1415574 RepID=UPI002AA0BA0A|nr:octanoyltransferase [Psychrobacter sp. LV10R520-6]